jgi:hypothetical protein
VLGLGLLGFVASSADRVRRHGRKLRRSARGNQAGPGINRPAAS